MHIKPLQAYTAVQYPCLIILIQFVAQRSPSRNKQMIEI